MEKTNDATMHEMIAATLAKCLEDVLTETTPELDRIVQGIDGKRYQQSFTAYEEYLFEIIKTAATNTMKAISSHLHDGERDIDTIMVGVANLIALNAVQDDMIGNAIAVLPLSYHTPLADFAGEAIVKAAYAGAAAGAGIAEVIISEPAIAEAIIAEENAE